jgi:hypothetical protein
LTRWTISHCRFDAAIFLKKKRGRGRAFLGT